MRIGWLQFTAVAGLLVAFAALLPTHQHSRTPADASASQHAQYDFPDGPASKDEIPPERSHPTHDCPICRIATSLTLLSAPTGILRIEPAPRFAPPIDQARPISAPLALPFHGRAPPAC